MDIIKINVPTFLRLLELVREDVKNDPDLHDIAEVVAGLSKQKVITMDDYDTIVAYMKRTGNDHEETGYSGELDDIKRLGGID